MTTDLLETTIRDFGGGWDVSDSDKALSSKFQPVSDNVVRGTDGHFRTRYGNRLFADFHNGVETTYTAEADTIATVNGSSVVTITKNAHGFLSGQHITISSFSADLNGITQAMMQVTHGIVVIDANNFKVYVRGVATGTGSAARTLTYVHDSHTLSGRTIFGRYYKDHLFVFAANGEIGTIDINGVVACVWNYQIAAALTFEPWTQCLRVSAEIVRGRLIAVNGSTNDKPLQIINTTVNYMVDESTLSNSAIPRADFVIAAARYVILVNTEYGPTKLEIGAKNTVMTCSREVAPDDAVEIDVGMLTSTVDSTILGAAVIRSRVFIAFSDLSMLGTLGIYTGVAPAQIHEPDFNDTLAQFGSMSHHTILSLGNDLFCAAINGVNSLELSKSSGEFTPQTISDLIHPVLLRHLNRLSEDDRRYKTFAVWDQTSRSYMLFIPKYTETSETLGTDPIYATSTLQPHNLMYIRYLNHQLDAGDYIDIAGATNFSATLTGAMINGRRLIRHVIDEDTLVVECDAYLPNVNQAYGGTTITITPVNDETVAYVYEYNLRLKIRRWTRFRDLQFAWGATSQFHRMFFGWMGKVYQFGDNNNKFSADFLGDYDYRTFANNFGYNVGDRVLDGTDHVVYQVLIAHTSPAAGTFAAARAAIPDNWEEYEGEPITWALETSWTDFKERMFNKQNELVRFDTKGTASFTISVFVNTQYRDRESYLLTPVVETEFVGEDTPGFGGGDEPFGGGRNTAQEWLHDLPAFGKLFKFRFSGSSTHPLQVNAATFYYHKSKVLT